MRRFELKISVSTAFFIVLSFLCFSDSKAEWESPKMKKSISIDQIGSLEDDDWTIGLYFNFKKNGYRYYDKHQKLFMLSDHNDRLILTPSLQYDFKLSGALVEDAELNRKPLLFEVRGSFGLNSTVVPLIDTNPDSVDDDIEGGAILDYGRLSIGGLGWIRDRPETGSLKRPCIWQHPLRTFFDRRMVAIRSKSLFCD